MKLKKSRKVLLQSGFTLIELLVVVAIISILSGILFPVFARARENARKASCLSNMKNLALAVSMYAQDNDGKLVPRLTPKADGSGDTTDWNRFSPVQPYMKSYELLFCPSAPTHNFGASAASGTTAYYAPQYGFPKDTSNKNGNWNDCGGKCITAIPYHGTTSMDSVPNASLTCLLGETNYSSSTSDLYLNSGYGATGFDAYDPTGALNGSLNTDRHLEGTNYAYMDGHVKWLKKETVKSAFIKQYHGANVTVGNSLPIVFMWTLK